MTTTPLTEAATRRLGDLTIRELVEAHPETMTVLAPLGIDLCCGGAHRVGEALARHGIDREPVLRQIARVIGAPTAPNR